MTNLSKGVNAFSWELGGRVVSNGVIFLISVILARLLSVEDFGLVGMAIVFISFTKAMMNLGLSSAIIQKKEITSLQLSTVFYINLFLGVIVTGILYFISPLVGLFYENELVGEIFQVLSLVFVITSLSQVQTAILKRNLSFKELNIRTVVGQFLGGAVGIIMAFNEFGVWSLVIQYLIAELTGLILLWSVSGWRPELKFQMKSISDLWMYGRNLYLASLLNETRVRLDVLIIGKIFNPYDLGLYTRSKTFTNLINNYLTTSVANVSFPLLSKIQDDKGKFQQYFLQVIKLISAYGYVIIVPLYLLIDQAIIILFGAKWIGSVPYAKILIAGALAIPLNSLVLNFAKAYGNSRIVLRLSIFKQISFFGIAAIGFQYGIITFLLLDLIVNKLFWTIYQNYLAAKIFEIRFKETFMAFVPFTVFAMTSLLIFEILWDGSLFFQILYVLGFVILYFCFIYLYDRSLIKFMTALIKKVM